nr:FAD-dependent oxidoreductase [Hydrotalea sp.]
MIGGGLSGLVAARQLQQLGAEVLVIEAKAAVGGCIQTHRGAKGTPMEMCATRFGPQHSYLQQLMQAFNIQRFSNGRVAMHG